MPVDLLNTRPSGLEKSWSSVRFERFTKPGAAADSAPKRNTSHVNVVAPGSPAASLIRTMCPLTLPDWLVLAPLISVYARGLAASTANWLEDDGLTRRLL